MGIASSRMASFSKSSHLIAGDAEPQFIYGTAWKKGETKRLVKEAIDAGFRMIDTAAQPRHYQEHLVGEALREIFKNGAVHRAHLYVSDIRLFTMRLLRIL
jgi:diketogulonate reductase-like aldo/keto reductase